MRARKLFIAISFREIKHKLFANFRRWNQFTRRRSEAFKCKKFARVVFCELWKLKSHKNCLKFSPKIRKNPNYRSIKDFIQFARNPFLLDGCEAILWTMPTCSGPRMSKLEPQNSSTEMKKDILLLDFPQNAGVRWNKNCPPPNQYKGIYTWTSTPRTVYQNRKLIRDNLNLQRWVFKGAAGRAPLLRRESGANKSFTSTGRTNKLSRKTQFRS